MDATSTQGCQNPPLSWTQALPRSASLPEVAASRHVQRVQANRRSPACCPPRTRIPPSAGIKLINERRIKILYGGRSSGGHFMDFPERPLKAQGGGHNHRLPWQQVPRRGYVGNQTLPVCLSRCRPCVF